MLERMALSGSFGESGANVYMKMQPPREPNVRIMNDFMMLTRMIFDYGVRGNDTTENCWALM